MINHSWASKSPVFVAVEFFIFYKIFCTRLLCTAPEVLLKWINIDHLGKASMPALLLTFVYTDVCPKEIGKRTGNQTISYKDSLFMCDHMEVSNV